MRRTAVNMPTWGSAPSAAPPAVLSCSRANLGLSQVEVKEALSVASEGSAAEGSAVEAALSRVHGRPSTTSVSSSPVSLRPARSLVAFARSTSA
eukprot:1788692-Prymnesium_polylepis.1